MINQNFQDCRYKQKKVQETGMVYFCVQAGAAGNPPGWKDISQGLSQ